MKKQVFNPSQNVTATVIEGPSEFEMPLVHQAFVPFHNLWGINSCFLRGAFDLDIETLEAGCTSGSPVVASGRQMAGFLQFPDLPGLCDWLRSRGFVPGLWFGFPYVSKGSPLLQERPDLFDLKTGTELQWEDAAPSKSVWLRPSPALTEHFRNVLAPFVAMGFGKFKLDFFGGPRAAMTGIVRCAHEAIVSLDPGGGNIYLYGNLMGHPELGCRHLYVSTVPAQHFRRIRGAASGHGGDRPGDDGAWLERCGGHGVDPRQGTGQRPCAHALGRLRQWRLWPQHALARRSSGLSRGECRRRPKRAASSSAPGRRGLIGLKRLQTCIQKETRRGN
jgi:hypothetical protein